MNFIRMNEIYSHTHLLEVIKNFVLFFRPILFVLDQLLKCSVRSILSHNVEDVVDYEIFNVTDDIRMIETL